MEMYADYIKERMGDDLVFNDKGFASYRFLNSDQVYIIDIYVKPEFRKQKVASFFADIIVDLAREKGCKEVLGTVLKNIPSFKQSKSVLEGYGMTIKEVNDSFIVFGKDI